MGKLNLNPKALYRYCTVRRKDLLKKFYNLESSSITPLKSHILYTLIKAYLRYKERASGSTIGSVLAALFFNLLVYLTFLLYRVENLSKQTILLWLINTWTLNRMKTLTNDLKVHKKYLKN